MTSRLIMFSARQVFLLASITPVLQLQFVALCRTDKFHTKVMDQTQIQICLSAGGKALTRIRSSGHMGSIADRR